MGNFVKTALLMAALTMLVVLLGKALGGRQGMMLAFLFAAVMNLGAYWFSDRIVLSMNGAQELAPEEAPVLYPMVERLAERAGIPVPRLYRVPERQPNAFATGRSPAHAAVAVTDGLLEILGGDEVEGVLAHELAHIRHRDTLIMTVAATFAGALTLMADMVRWGALFGGMSERDEDDRISGAGALILAIVAPLAALLLQMAISRSREYAADEAGARYSGRPLSLAQALVRIESAAHQLPMHVTPATAPLYIVHPFAGQGALGWIGSLFQTHPPTEVRVARLYALAGMAPRQAPGWQTGRGPA